MTVIDLNSRRVRMRQLKANALRGEAKALLGQPPVDLTTPAGLRALARCLDAHRDDTPLWEVLAERAAVNPPGSSYDPTRDLPADKYRTIDLVVADLHQEADDLEDDLAALSG